MSLVKVGRPMFLRSTGVTIRPIMVQGRTVGTIEPVEGRTGRARGWYVWDREIPHDRMQKPLHWSATLAGAVAWAQSYESWPVQCWVYGSGSYGCLYDNVGCTTSRQAAVESLCDLFELGDGRRARELRRDGYVSLGRAYGADYAEVSPCSECEACADLTTGDLAEGWEGECCNNG